MDDPYWFGQISAANSLSDVYAMGGRPLTALNVVMFPSKQLDIGFLKGILRGGSDKVVEAGASLAGGHTVDDNEPKYGLAVTGIVHPERILTNCGAKKGDAMILTKPLGTGVLFNACRGGKLPSKELEPLLYLVASLNAKAIKTALNFKINSCTDVTGFGIVGHALEIAKGSGMQINLFYRNLPVYPNVIAMYRKGVTTGSNKPNRKLSEGFLEIKMKLSSEEEELLFDPQTSGGLLMSVDASQADELIRELQNAGIDSAVCIGEVVSSNEPGVQII